MQRNLTIDIAKGIGILLVVYGHNYAVSHNGGELYRIIFSFHMPLFFFLSGLFFKPSEGFGTLLTSKFDVLLKPYLAVLIPVALIAALSTDQALQESLLAIVWGTGPSLGKGATAGWLQMWFLPHLFLIYCFGLTAVVLIEKSGIRRTATKLLTLIAMAAIGVFLLPLWQSAPPAEMGLTAIPVAKSYISPGWIFSVDLLPITLAYFLAGYVLAGRIKNFKPHKLMLAVALSVFSCLHIVFDESINFNSRSYNSFPVASLQALFGIYIVLCAAAFISRIDRLADALAFAGAGSLFILIFHAYFQNKTTGVLHNKFMLGIDISAFAGFLAGVLLPLAIYVIARRNRWLALLLLPRRSRPGQQATLTQLA